MTKISWKNRLTRDFKILVGFGRPLAVFLLLLYIGLFSRFVSPHLLHLPTELRGARCYLEHLLSGFGLVIFAACIYYGLNLREARKPIDHSLCAIASSVVLFNLSWEFSQGLGWAFYAASPGHIQWDQIFCDLVAVVFGVLFVPRLNIRGIFLDLGGEFINTTPKSIKLPGYHAVVPAHVFADFNDGLAGEIAVGLKWPKVESRLSLGKLQHFRNDKGFNTDNPPGGIFPFKVDICY